jgi:hypothetical protein
LNERHVSKLAAAPKNSRKADHQNNLSVKMPPLFPDMISMREFPPPPHTHDSLTVRSSGKDPTTLPTGQEIASSPALDPEYPIRIPPEKLSKAIELYTTFVLAQTLKKDDNVSHDGYILSPPESSRTSKVPLSPRAAQDIVLWFPLARAQKRECHLRHSMAKIELGRDSHRWLEQKLRWFAIWDHVSLAGCEECLVHLIIMTSKLLNCYELLKKYNPCRCQSQWSQRQI